MSNDKRFRAHEQKKLLRTANLKKMATVIGERPYQHVRFLLTDKKGNIELVVMGPQTYAFLNRVLNEWAAQEEALPRDEQIKKAIARMRGDREKQPRG